MMERKAFLTKNITGGQKHGTYGLEKLGITNTGKIYRNLEVARLVEESLKRGEGILMNTGALAVTTGKYYGPFS